MLKNILEEKNILRNHLWETLVPILPKYSLGEKEVSPNTADKYIYDFYGLLKHLNTPDEYLYPHLRINGLDTSSDYDGKKTIILLLDTNALVSVIDTEIME